MALSTAAWGDLRSMVVGPEPAGSPLKLGVILCHGFGAPGDDLVPLAEALQELAPELQSSVQFVFPEGPVSLTGMGIPGGRAWWPLNMAQLQQRLQTRDFAAIRNERPDGLVAARTKLDRLIQDYSAASGLPTSQIVLGGFSQGSMATVDVAIHGGRPLSGLALLSGAVVNEPEWTEKASRLHATPVFQSHGKADVVLPFVAGGWLRDLLTAAGAQVSFVEFTGGHGIPWEVLRPLAQFLADRLAAAQSNVP